MSRGLTDKRILIVEDENILALDIALEVAGRGAKVIGPVGTLRVALGMIASTNLDGVILDIDLSGKIAFAVADALADRQIPFVFATGYPITQIPARHANVRRCEKPARPSIICRALEAAMSMAPREE